MNLQPIRNHDDLQRAFARMDELWGAAIGTPEGDELDILAILIKRYEDEYFPTTKS